MSMLDLSLPAWLREWLTPLFRRACPPRPRRRPGLEPLDARELLSVSTLTNVLAAGDTVTLQPNNMLWRTDPGGNTTLLDNQTQAIAAGLDASGRPALFDLKTNGHLYALTVAGGWSLLDDGARSIASSTVETGQPVLFDLKTDGRLYAYTTGGWTFMASNVAALASGFNSTGQPIAFEQTGASLYVYNIGVWAKVDGAVSMIASGQDASGRPALFDLKTNGQLFAWTATSGWALLDSASWGISTGVGPDGQQALFDFKINGQVWSYNQDGWIQVKNSDVTPPPSKGLSFANQTSKTIYVALDYHVPATATTAEAWQVTGWYTIAPGQTLLVRPAIDNEFYEYYAYSPGGSTWGGNFTLPITYGSFSYNSLDQALEASLTRPGTGYIVKGFRSLDVGATNVYGSYTVDLSAANAS
jgi:hypothetical protein